MSQPGGYKEMSSIFADQWRPRIRVPMRGRDSGIEGSLSANERSCAHHVTLSPNKLWRSTSTYNLWSKPSLPKHWTLWTRVRRMVLSSLALRPILRALDSPPPAKLKSPGVTSLEVTCGLSEIEYNVCRTADYLSYKEGSQPWLHILCIYFL